MMFLTRMVTVIIALVGPIRFANNKVTLSVPYKINRYGENIKLLCNATDCCSKKNTMRWYGGPEEKVLGLYGNEEEARTSGNEKYAFSIEKGGFGLVIKNLEMSDLNVSYKCSYGFDISNSTLLTQDNVFLDEVSINETMQNKGPAKEYQTDKTDKTGLIVAVILSVILCVIAVVMILLIILYRRGKLPKSLVVCRKQNNRKPKDVEADAANGERVKILDDAKPKFPDEGDKDFVPTTDATNSSYPILSNGHQTQIQDENRNSGNISEINNAPNPKYPTYKTETLRLESFTQRSNFKLSPEVLAKAGFFSCGDSDMTRCFYCGCLLKDWKENDDPWEVHAEFFPQCPHLLEKKGNDYVTRIQSEKMKREQDESSTRHERPS